MYLFYNPHFTHCFTLLCNCFVSCGLSLENLSDEQVLVKILFMAPIMVYCSIINLLWRLMSKSTTFPSVSYGPCSRTGVTCVASDFGEISEATHVTPVREQGP